MPALFPIDIRDADRAGRGSLRLAGRTEPPEPWQKAFAGRCAEKSFQDVQRIYGNRVARVHRRTAPQPGYEATNVSARGARIHVGLIFQFKHLRVWRRGRDSNPGYSF